MSAPPGLDALAHPATEPLPVLAARPSLKATFASLSVPNFRWYMSGLAASSAGAWLARLATDWLMIELTGDVALVALVVMAQLVPSMILGVWGGVIGDRFNARTTVITVQCLYLLSVLGLAIPAILGVATVPLILITSLGIGVSAAFEGPSRAVLLVEVVGTRTLPNAMSLNAAVQQFAGIFGAALTGVLVALLGVGWAMAIAAAGPLIGIIALSCMRRDRMHPAIKVPAQRGQIREALRYVRRKRQIALSMLLIIVLAIFGLTGSVLFAWAAHEKFAMGAVGYSMFQTAGAVGALLGSLLSARRRQLRLFDNAAMLALSSLIWAFTGFAPWPALFIVCLVASLTTRLIFMVGNDSLTQLSTNGAIRGRIVSLYLIAATSAQTLGAAMTGWAVHQLGGELTFVLTGAIPFFAAVAVMVVLIVRRRRAEALLRMARLA